MASAEVFTKSTKHTVTQYSADRFVVVSGTSGHAYGVTRGEMKDGSVKFVCTCPFGEEVGWTAGNPETRTCSHVIAVRRHLGHRVLLDRKAQDRVTLEFLESRLRDVLQTAGALGVLCEQMLDEVRAMGERMDE